MTDAQFAEFWQSQDYRVVETASCFWYTPAPLVLMSLSFHRPLSLPASELAWVFLKGLPAVVRFPEATSDPAAPSGIFVCSHKSYGLNLLEHRARNQTRRALERCAVQQIDFAYAERHGYPLALQTLTRQGRASGPRDERRWRAYCAAAAGRADLEAWAAFAGGRLAGLLVGVLLDDRYVILRQNSATEYLSSYPNNALAFTVTQAKLKTEGISGISYGLRSAEPTPGLERFKRNMGYVLEPTLDRIVLNPLVRPFARLGRVVFEKAVQANPRRDFFRKGLSALAHLL
jgi:hypothetical protein